MKPYPDFLIIGAAKAGTTALVEYLSQHPAVYFSPIKEPHFFSKDIRPQNFNQHYYDNIMVDVDQYFKNKPLQNIFEAYVRKESQYLQLFENAKPHQLKGEASTTYLYSQVAAKEIQNQIPGVKLLIILRNPLQRAYSHYLMALKFGFTSLPFFDAIREDQARTQKGWGISELYLELGLYYEQLKRYFALFPEEQIKVLFYEDFLEDPEKTLEQVTQFLEISSMNFDLGKTPNKGSVPRFAWINQLLNRWGLRMKLASCLPEPLKGFLKKYYLKNPGSSLDDHPEAKQYLQDFYRADIEKTATLLNKDLSHWLA